MRRLATLLSLAAASTLGAQGHDAHAGHAGPAVHPAIAAHPRAYAGRVLTVTAKDFAFELPDTVEAGYTTVRLLSRGKELHHVQLLRLDGGHTLKDLFAAMQGNGGPPPAWMVEVGGPNAPVPGSESAAALDLAPGRYAVVCFIPSPDGTPHIMKGMAKEFVAVAAKKKAAAVKAPAVTATLSDYDFTLSRPLVAGDQVIRIVNAAAQHHEMLLVRLEAGRTPADFARWTEKQDSPPPATPIGGITGMDKGQWNDVAVTLAPGEYGLICFLPDAKDGQPHFMHGMMKQFSVAPRVASK